MKTRYRKEVEYGFVYFASAANDFTMPIKIGWSIGPWGAVREAGRWGWYDLQIVALIPIKTAHWLFGTSGTSLERLAHEALKDCQIRREWFRPDEPVLRLVDMALDGAAPETIAQDLTLRLEAGSYRNWWDDLLDRSMRRAG